LVCLAIDMTLSRCIIGLTGWLGKNGQPAGWPLLTSS